MVKALQCRGANEPLHFQKVHFKTQVIHASAGVERFRALVHEPFPLGAFHNLLGRGIGVLLALAVRVVNAALRHENGDQSFHDPRRDGDARIHHHLKLMPGQIHNLPALVGIMAGHADQTHEAAPLLEVHLLKLRRHARLQKLQKHPVRTWGIKCFVLAGHHEANLLR
jgi:hypothetical protein